MFFDNSRYAGAGTYVVTLPDGRLVTATKIPLPTRPRIIGFHPRLDGQRLDLIAFRYLADATAFWQLCNANNSISPDALGQHRDVGIPEIGG
jgi:hypothetical protein